MRPRYGQAIWCELHHLNVSENEGSKRLASSRTLRWLGSCVVTTATSSKKKELDSSRRRNSFAFTKKKTRCNYSAVSTSSKGLKPVEIACKSLRSLARRRGVQNHASIKRHVPDNLRSSSHITRHLHHSARYVDHTCEISRFPSRDDIPEYHCTIPHPTAPWRPQVRREHNFPVSKWIVILWHLHFVLEQLVHNHGKSRFRRFFLKLRMFCVIAIP